LNYEQIEMVVDLARQHGGSYEEQLLKIFDPLIIKAAHEYHRRYCSRLVELDDCVIYAKVAFVILLRRYDRTRSGKFVPYIKRFLSNQIQKQFESELHVPRRVYYRAVCGKPTAASYSSDELDSAIGIVFPDQLEYPN